MKNSRKQNGLSLVQDSNKYNRQIEKYFNLEKHPRQKRENAAANPLYATSMAALIL